MDGTVALRSVNNFFPESYSSAATMFGKESLKIKSSSEKK